MTHRTYARLMRTLAVLALIPPMLHLTLGVSAETLLDPTLPAGLAGLASLDSQNRFYGVAFSVFGLLLWRSAEDPQRFAPVLRIVLGVFFLAGLARVISAAVVGVPSFAIVALTAIELIAPPLLHLASRRVCAELQVG